MRNQMLEMKWDKRRWDDDDGDNDISHGDNLNEEKISIEFGHMHFQSMRDNAATMGPPKTNYYWE